MRQIQPTPTKIKNAYLDELDNDIDFKKLFDENAKDLLLFIYADPF